MAKKRVLFRHIESDSSRKSNLKKNSSYLIKKLQELCILCGIIACIMISSPEIEEPIFWPPLPDIEEILTRFESVPDIERYPKTTSHEGFMKENVKKLEEQLTKHLKQIKRIEMNEMMYQIFTLGKRFNEFPIDKLISLHDYIEEQVKSLDKRINYLEKPANVGDSSSSRQEKGTSRRVDEILGEALLADEGEKIENIITNPIGYIGIDNVVTHWSQASPYREIVAFGGSDIGSISGSYQGTTISHGQASMVNVSSTTTYSFHPERTLGGSDSNSSIWGVEGGIEDPSSFKALAPHVGGQETIEGNISTSQSDDMFPFVKGWGLVSGYVSGGLHDVVLSQRRMASGSIGGTNEASTQAHALRNQCSDEGVDHSETGGGTNEASGSGSNAGAMK